MNILLLLLSIAVLVLVLRTVLAHRTLPEPPKAEFRGILVKLGEHLLCLVCQRILIVPRQKAPPEMSEEAKEPETEKKAVAGAGG